MNNGLFELGASPSYTPINSSQNLLGVPSVIPTIYSYPQNKTVQVNYNNLVFVIDTTKSSGRNRIFSISLEGTVSCFIDWGDGSVERFTTTGIKSHTYASFGEYTIQIYGTLTGFSMLNASTNRLPLTKCLSFGTLPLTSFDFHSCSNLIQVPDNIPTGVTTLNSALFGCSSFNWPVNSWNTSRITSMTFTFGSCSIFNQDLNMWDTRNVTNFNNCFNGASRFNKPINSWNVGKCSNFNTMFNVAREFNQDISNWNIGEDSSVTSINMANMFNGDFALNQDFNNWNMSKTTSIDSMFFDCRVFNGNVSGWNLTQCTNLANVFSFCTSFNKPLSWINTSGNTSLNGFLYSATSFNQPLADLDVSRVSTFNACFQSASSFNQPLSGWNIGGNAAVTTVNMTSMFQGATLFNQPLNSWDISKVNNFSSMFNSAPAFNQPLSGWNIGGNAAVTTINMSNMFASTTLFNQSLNSWNVSKVNNFNNMFNTSSAFNQPLSGWNIGGSSSVTSVDMSYMFMRSRFNQNISNWNTSKVNNMFYMFLDNTVYNQPMNSWDVSKVTSFASMFQGNTTINQDLGNWNVSGVNTNGGLDGIMFGVTTMSTSNYNSILTGWESRKSLCRSDLRPNFGSSKYSASGSAASVARAALVAYGWTISDGGSVITAPDPPTSVTGTAGDTQVPLSWAAPTYNNGSAITDYAIQYSSNSGSSWTTFSDGVSTAISGTVTGLTNGTPYIFRVAAINATGTGNYSSNSSSVTPVAAVSFSPTAVILTAGSSYTVPAGATNMKAWAVGGGGGTNGPGGGAGGTSFKTWSVSGGSSVAYVVGSAGALAASPNHSNGGNSTVTYDGTTITGSGGGRGDSGGAGNGTGGGYSGGDGGANGGNGTLTNYPYKTGGAVGGNSQSILICAGYGENGRRPATDVSGLQAAVTLAGGIATQACGSTDAFGSSSHGGEKNAASQNAGLGGGAAWDFGQGQAGGGAVVLYFT